MGRVCHAFFQNRHGVASRKGKNNFSYQKVESELMKWSVLLLVSLAFAGCATEAPAPPAPEPWTAPQPIPGEDNVALSQTGRWLAPFEGEVAAVNMGLLPGGDVLYYSGVEAREQAGPTEWTFFTSNPHEGESRRLHWTEDGYEILTPEHPAGAAGDLFCSGHTILADGTLLAAGGSDWHDNTTGLFLKGSHDARIYDPETNAWNTTGDMLLNRWYPTIMTLQDGSALAASGIGELAQPTEMWEPMETYQDGTWTGEAANELLPLYPRLFVVPSGPMKGHVFYNTVGTMWGPFGEHPLQLDWGYQYDIDLEAGTVEQLELSVYGGRQHANSVMLPLLPETNYKSEILTFGGSLYQAIAGTAFTELADLSTSPPTNTELSPLHQARWHANGVNLPTGDILVVGGGVYDNVVVHGQPNIPIMEAELWSPATRAWTELPSMNVERMYHSTAILLDDGRVLAGGHVPLPVPFPVARDTVEPQIVETRLEIYEPGYLFRGERPNIASGDQNGTYGSTLDLVIGGEVSGFMLARPGQTTHAWDNNQRMIGLEWTGNDHNYTVTLPPDADIAPPGDYMVFALREHPDGPVPSDAHWIRIENL